MSVVIRSAVASDAALILGFVEGLADYEKLRHEAQATEADIVRDLFGPDPKVFCELAFAGERPVGFALWYYTYSTFQGRHGLWLEDLFVLDSERGRGYGKALMRALAAVCVERGYSRFEWTVLDWNEPAIGFYRSLGVTPLTEWTTQRLTGDALLALAT